MDELQKQEIATLIAEPQAIRIRLAKNLRESEVLKRLLKTAEFAAEKMSEPEVAR